MKKESKDNNRTGVDDLGSKICKKRLEYEKSGNKKKGPILVSSTNQTMSEGNKIDDFYKNLGPHTLYEFKRVQSRFATFQTFLQVFPEFELKKKANKELRLRVCFDSVGKVYKLDAVGSSVLDLIPHVIKFINELPEDVKKKSLNM